MFLRRLYFGGGVEKKRVKDCEEVSKRSRRMKGVFTYFGGDELRILGKFGRGGDSKLN